MEGSSFLTLTLADFFSVSGRNNQATTSVGKYVIHHYSSGNEIKRFKT